jgi:hypothetical protein
MAIRHSVAVHGRRVELGNGTAVEFSSDVTGEARQWLPSAGRLRVVRTPSEQDLPPEVQLALDEHEVIEQEAIQFELVETPAGDVAEVTPANGVPDGFAQVVLYADESGALSWHFGKTSLERSRSGLTRQRFTIPMRTETARATNALRLERDGLRSIGSFLGRKLFKVLLLPISIILGDPVRALVEQWEKRSREEMLRTLTLDDLRDPDPPRFTDWDRLAGGRALLVIHGIFSSTQGMLSKLAEADLSRLSAQYAGRVIAFDHFTASRSPEENVRWLMNDLRQRAPGRRFEFDVLCHSRGGIVARTLRERAHDFDADGIARIRKIFFAATPNRGSALADADRIVDLIDVFTNIGAVVSGGSAAIALDVVFGLLKLVAYTAITQVPGIRAMGRGRTDYINAVLNAATIDRPTDYAAVAANYESSDGGGALMTIADSVIDRVFGADTANDLVVPTDGVYMGLGLQKAKIAAEVYRSGIWHTELFGNPTTIDVALRHFNGANEPRETIEVRPAGRPKTRSTRGRTVADELDSDDFDRTVRAGRPEVSATPMTTTMTTPIPSEVPVPAAAAASPEVAVERDPTIDFLDQVQPGVPATLTVSLDERDPATAASDDTVTVVLPEGQESIDVVAQLFAPGFTIQGESHAKLTVRRRRIAADETARFTLVANPVTKTTRRQIVVGLSVDGIPVGGTSFITTVVGSEAAPEPQSEREDPPTPPKPSFDPRAADRADADLKIIVSDLSEDGSHYSLKVTSKVRRFVFESKSFGEFDAPNGIVEILNETLKILFAERPSRRLSAEEFAVALCAWNVRMIDTLRNLGMDLWTFLPEEFRRFYFELHDAGTPPRAIHIISDDMLFPWELVIPHRVTAGRKVKLAPLGSAHVIGRWRPGLTILPDPQTQRVGNIAIVNPTYTAPDLKLPASQQEATDLQTFFGDANVTVTLVRPASLDDVRTQVLNAANVQMLHFTGHAKFHESNANSSALLLDAQEQLTASELANGDFTAGAPIIIINACSVGKIGMVASRAGGFAERCLSNGCAAVLAAHWEISDRSAAEFSSAFYQKLKLGRTFGEALQELRIEKQDDPTYHAYMFFGDPLSRIVL